MYFNASQYKAFLEQNRPGHQQQLCVDAGVPFTAEPSLEVYRASLRYHKQKIVERDSSQGRRRWFRPWDVVPKLKDWKAPKGDYGIGVEIELGFTNQEACRKVAARVQKWEHITLDFEGGQYPIEATFPPVLYSEIGPRTQFIRYLDYLNENKAMVVKHQESSNVGTHINVSVGGRNINPSRCTEVNRVLQTLTQKENKLYFGRIRPYGHLFAQPEESTRDRWIEFKMFNSTLDAKALQKYIDVSVALADLVVSRKDVSLSSVRDALELGYRSNAVLNEVVDNIPVSA